MDGPGAAKIADIKAQLGLRGPGRPKATAATATANRTERASPAKRRTISKAGRARIAAATENPSANLRRRGNGTGRPSFSGHHARDLAKSLRP
jgi:hypothetical protein